MNFFLKNKSNPGSSMIPWDCLFKDYSMIIINDSQIKIYSEQKHLVTLTCPLPLFYFRSINYICLFPCHVINVWKHIVSFMS